MKHVCLLVLSVSLLCVGVVLADDFRPRYTGYNKLEIERVGPAETRQGLDELASRWGVKPYAKLHRGMSLQSARVIFRDVQTGAMIWRITDDPYSVESHRYADYSGWNRDGSLIGLSTPRWYKNGNGLLMRGAAADVRVPGFGFSAGMVWDPTDPVGLYAYDGNLVRRNVLTAAKKVILSGKRLRAIMEPQYLPNKPWVQLFGVSEDGKWLIGRAGGNQDEGRVAFLVRTDGSGEMRHFKTAGGIHYGLVLRTTPVSVCFSLAGVKQPMQVWHMKDDSWEVMPYRMSHRVWGPTGDRVAWSHGMKGPGGYWGLVNWSRTTRKMVVMSRASNYNEGHQTWCHYDPDWVLATYQSPGAPGADLLKLKADGSRTAFRICNTMMKWPQYTVYSNNAFGASSPDGTKVMFGGNTLGSKDTYLAIVKHPEAPRDLKATRTFAGTTMTWEAPRNAREIAGYCIYRRVSGITKKEPLSFSIDGGRTWPVRTEVPVAAWKWVWCDTTLRTAGIGMRKGTHAITFSTKHFGAAIDAVVLTSPGRIRGITFANEDKTPPGKVADLAVKATDTYDVTLTWTHVADADVHHYDIYRSTGGRVEAKQRCLVGSPDAGPFVDWGLKPETTYGYTITAVDRRGNESPAANVVVAKTKALSAPRHVAPIDLAAAVVKAPSKRDADGSITLAGKIEVPFSVPRDGVYQIWFCGRTGTGSAAMIWVRMDDDKSEQRWTMAYDATALFPGKPSTHLLWEVVTPREYDVQGRFKLTAGKHTFKMRGSNLFIRKLVITNDFGFVPKGDLNTLYYY